MSEGKEIKMSRISPKCDDSRVTSQKGENSRVKKVWAEVGFKLCSVGLR